MTSAPTEWIELLDWKRQIFSLYERIRNATEPADAWTDFRRTRTRMFQTHSESPVPAERRDAFELSYFDYDPKARVLAEIAPAEEAHYEIATSGEGTYGFTRIAAAAFELVSVQQELELYWLDGYGGGLFLPFRDATASQETYGGGRYLFDTIKGADLGVEGG
ncbi:MAG: DUF1684 domain-containing protein, partial [Acidobacteria bacterium]|nr:DUF1684 domain-containing protein [Acidobacteriota bacterium]